MCRILITKKQKQQQQQKKKKKTTKFSSTHFCFILNSTPFNNTYMCFNSVNISKIWNGLVKKICFTNVACLDLVDAWTLVSDVIGIQLLDYAGDRL